MNKKIWLLFFVMLGLPLLGQVYSNGPINGTTDAWTINSGFVVSDTFTVPSGGSDVAGLVFGAWTFPGDVLESAEISISSSEFGGATYFAGVVNFTQSGCSGNQYGFNVCTENGSLNNTFLGGGTYWLNLSNAVVNDGDPIYWDENSGPSKAVDWPRTTAIGTIPSEAFTVLGGTCGNGGDCLPSQTVPEPGGFLLLASGSFAIAGLRRLLRRKLF